jgi:hydrogenase maturation protease
LSEKKVAVIGIGNILMGDEGAGIMVIEELEKRRFSGDITFIDAGTAFFSIVSTLRDYDKLIIVDAVYGGGKAGTIYRFGVDDVAAREDRGLSLHDFGVLESIQLERIVARFPRDVVFYGIEPESVSLSLNVSFVCRKAVMCAVQKIIDELGCAGIYDDGVKHDTLRHEKPEYKPRRNKNGCQCSKTPRGVAQLT